MVQFVSLYEQDQIDSCIVSLTKMSSSGVSELDCLLAKNNLAVCKYQQSFMINDVKLRNSARESLYDALSTVSCLPLSQAVSQLTLVTMCNIFYCDVINGDSKKLHDRANVISCQALERVAACHGILCSQMYLHDKFMFLLENLVHSRRLDKTETHIILYICILIFLGDENYNVVKIIEQILSICDDICETQNESYFLISPLKIKLVTSGQEFFLFVPELAGLVLLISSFNNTECYYSLSVKKIKHSQLTSLFQFLKLYAKVQFKDSSCSQLNFVASENELRFAMNLLEAVKFSEKQHSLAIRLCSLVVNGAVGHTKLCSIPLMYSALQFQILGEQKFQIEALKVAEDSLLNCPAMECSFHIQPAAFLVGKLNLFRIPTLSMIHYHLGRALLGNKEYGKAAIEYQKLRSTTYKIEWCPNICNFPPPLPSVVGHEHILSLLLSRQFEVALQLIPSLEQDFLILFLHAEIIASKEQFIQSIQLLNRAVCQTSCSSIPTEKSRNFLLSRLHWRMSQIFQKCGNTKDCFFQLKMALELSPYDSNLIQHSVNYAQHLGVSVSTPQILVIEEAKMKDTITTLLSVQNDLSLKYLIEICNAELISDV